MNELNNWDLLAFFTGGAACFWAASQCTPVARAARKLREAKNVRLANRCVRLERLWRSAARDRDRAQMEAAAVRAENEALTDELATAGAEVDLLRPQVPGLGRDRAAAAGHPCIPPDVPAEIAHLDFNVEG